MSTKVQDILGRNERLVIPLYRSQYQWHDCRDGNRTGVWESFGDAWWRMPVLNARPRRPRIDHFLVNLLTAETGERTTVRELYAEYRARATPNRRPHFEAVEEELIA